MIVGVLVRGDALAEAILSRAPDLSRRIARASGLLLVQKGILLAGAIAYFAAGPVSVCTVEHYALVGALAYAVLGVVSAMALYIYDRFGVYVRSDAAATV